MRLDVVENNGERLQLQLATNVPLYLIFGALFVLMGLWCTRLLAVEASIVVEQQRFAYTQTCLWVLECGAVHAASSDVRGVSLVDHEIEVQLADGPHRLALPHSGGDEKSAIARDIEAALAQPAASFRHVEGSPLAGLSLGLVCIGGGLLILSAIQWITLTADRASGTLRLERRLLLWPRVNRHEIRLADLETVRVIPSTLRTGRHIVTSYSAGLQTRGQRPGDSLRVSFLPMFTEGDATNLAQIILAWMR